ncbi:hypothetical protein QTL97_07880 [Sporosarcina thermotolerans]|uniref:Uncharacterized protein n=1 Tax=Sporosarcina thermotolerans TaxID=633404 RepID=A0AAW9AB19_9BACL|nr:hypothetical protein [Sporosarcina thermotolerans]MDW0116848.1 hypothetical protein [Sporosarcina thermotolerans]WHT48018.1 hypothetical protein QNH10_18540 [Sporosarcina thermotolerans]
MIQVIYMMNAADDHRRNAETIRKTTGKIKIEAMKVEEKRLNGR